MRGRIVALVIVVFCMSLVAQAFAKDIYVSFERGKNKKGEGTIESPYKNIVWASKQAEPGDVIRIAAGTYPGEGKSGHWVIEKNNLAFVGGYTEDFTSRDPFTNVTLLAYENSAANKTKRFPGPDFEAIKDGDATVASELGGITLDGLTFDGGPRNVYFDKPDNNSLRADKSPNDFLLHVAVVKGTKAIIRNCTFLNSGRAPAITLQCEPGASAEVYNNVIVNSIFHQLDLGTKRSKDFGRADFDVHHNTIAFSWRDNENGSGVYVRPYVNANIHENIIAFGDAWAVSNAYYEEKYDEKTRITKKGFMNENVSLDNNIIYMWQRGLYGWAMEKQSGLLSTTTLDDLEDTSLASAEDNLMVDPKLTCNKEWFQQYLMRDAAVQGEVTDDLVNQILSALGLPLRGEGQTRQNYCMRYPLADAMQLRVASAEEAKGFGARLTVMDEAVADAEEE